MKRINVTLISAPEERFLAYITPKLPSWCSPDFLTLTSLAAAILVAIFYTQSVRVPLYLLAVNLCIVINWFTDSTDGRIARFRGISRPNYGYYVDHICDSVGLVFVILGIIMSGLVLTPSWIVGGFLVLLVYIHTYLKTTVFQEFDPSLYGFGPTEMRLLLMFINFSVFFLGNPTTFFSGIQLTRFDYIGWVLSVVTLAALSVNIFKTISLLYQRERV